MIQKSNWTGFEDSGTSSLHYQGQVDCFDHSSTALGRAKEFEAQIGWGFVEGFGKT